MLSKLRLLTILILMGSYYKILKLSKLPTANLLVFIQSLEPCLDLSLLDCKTGLLAILVSTGSNEAHLATSRSSSLGLIHIDRLGKLVCSTLPVSSFRWDAFLLSYARSCWSNFLTCICSRVICVSGTFSGMALGCQSVTRYSSAYVCIVRFRTSG